jgi:hypothetical protein
MRLPFSLQSRVNVTPSCATAIVVSLLPLLYFFPATRGDLIISPDDGVIFNVPLRVAAANLIRGGYLPLWDPYIFCGLPLFGAAQAGVLFPLNWSYLAFSPAVATNLMMLATYVVAALGAYLYARRSGSNIAGAALTSIVWQSCGFLIAQIGHTNILHTAALLPWVLWAVDGYGAEGKRSQGLLLALLVAVQVFAGHQQTLVYGLLVVTAYALVLGRASQKTKPRPTEAQANYFWSLAYIAAGLLLAAVQILPTLELLRNSLRADASYDFFTSFSLPRRFLWTFFAPYVLGGGAGELFRAPYVGPAFYGEYVCYVGLLTVVLGMLALVFKRDVRTRLWALVALAGIALALGRYAPFGSYKLIYFVPLLNLFRVPARHLMEVQFALAVLAGRGLTAVAETQERSRVLRWVAASGLVALIVTALAVTIGRPESFRLGRPGPVSILRAPELFLPLVVAAAGAGALWLFARRASRATVLLLLVVLAADLCLWGQSSGWRLASPASDFELWTTPATVEFLRGQDNTTGDGAPYRILTMDQSFDPGAPAKPEASVAAPGTEWLLALQPDIYMMHDLENAAGYDGFGLARYSRLAGDMKVWGELTEPERTLRGAGREVDLLNVRYLLAKSSAAAALTSQPERAAAGGSGEFPPATQTYGGQRFGAIDLSLAPIASDQQLTFTFPQVEADRISLLTNLNWSDAVPDGTIVAHLQLRAADGTPFNFELRAGEHTSEWAYDRPDIRARIKHRRAIVGTSYEVDDAQAKYQAHTYVASFSLPRKTLLASGELTVARLPRAPDLTLGVFQLALANDHDAYPLRRNWLKKESIADAPSAESDRVTSLTTRWRRLADVGKVTVFENRRVLPRAWLATGELVVSPSQELEIIRQGMTPGGGRWDPLAQALVENSSGIAFAPSEKGRGNAAVTKLEPNRIEVKTESANPALLVLSANHYPGWRAYVDGESAAVLRVNYNQRGVAVSAGSHLVTFVYRPKSVLIGLVISLLTLAALIWWSRMKRLSLRKT